MKWEPLVDEKNIDTYKTKLSEISDVLLKNTEKVKSNIGVMGGKAGIALFFFYYANLTMEEKYVDFAHELITDIFDEINKEFSLHTFAGGLAGVGWMMEHLVKNEFVEADTDEILESLDPFLHKAMIYDIEKKNYDFLHGAVGTGTYFLSRLPKKSAEDNLIELVDHLDKISLKQEHGIAWQSVLDHEKGNEGINLSLSHGISAIIVFLSKLGEQGIYTEKVSTLLEGTVDYLMSQALDPKEFKSTYPSWISEDYPPGQSRLAWCYGDLGVGSALWQAAQSAQNKKWEENALNTLLLTTARKDPKENSVIDVGLCHGAAGIAHIYNRVYQQTGNGTFKESALYWFDQSLKMAVYEDGYAGYKAWHTEKYGGWVSEPGFLEGVAGIGLALISAISDIDPNWDHSLYLS
ncbi:MAG: lanthionine synthetase C family protein [bacterium]|nr:lanthionine synthetase C family protein [bacterium]